MIYRILKILLKITVRVYFKKYSVQHEDRIPEKGPLIFVANHPGTFMDPIVIAVSTRRRIHFIAKGEVFRSRFAKWLLPKFNMIPIYRREHDPEKAHLNEEVFNQVYNILEQGGCILIFPEGISLEGRQLQKIKSGAARMALGAEMKNDFKLGVKIMPVGLNFTNPYRFQETLMVNIDMPIVVRDYQETCRQDSFKAAHQLSDEIRNRLENLFVRMVDKKENEIVTKIETIYRAQLLRDMGYSSKIPEQVFEASGWIKDSVRYFMEKDPDRVGKVELMIDDYFKMLHKAKTNEEFVSRTQRKGSFWLRVFATVFYLIAGFPLFVFGLINNYLPFRIPYTLAKRLKVSIEYLGAVTMVTGMFTFLIFYSMQIWLSWYIFHDVLITLVYAVLLPVSGLFAYAYGRRITIIRGNWHLTTLFFTQSHLVAEIIQQRNKIIQELEKGKAEFETRSIQTN